MQLVQDDQKIQIEPEAIFLMVFGARMNLSFITKVKILSYLLNDHIDPPNYVDY
jgi:hypothetical protein